MHLLLTKIEDYMLPCISKQVLNIDCMGCGLQRSTLLIIKGQFIDAFLMYPAIYTLIALLVFLLFNRFKKVKQSTKIISVLAYTNLFIIVTSYLIKLNL